MSDNPSLGQLSKGVNIDSYTSSLQGTQKESRAADVVSKEAQVVASQETLQSEELDNSAMGIQIRTQKLEKKKEVKTEKAKQVEESVLVRKEDADGLADGFSKRQGNREYRLDPRLLSQLAEDLGVGIHEHSNPNEMIAFIRQRMTTIEGESPDVSIVDKAFEFLLEATHSQLQTATGPAKERLGAIYKNLESAKLKHFAEHADKIQIAQKIIGAVDAVVEKTGRSVKETLDHYRDVVHNPPDLQALRKFYEAKGYKAMILELKGLSTYLGGNLKRSNLESPELSQLASAVRKMQGLLGVFRQTKSHIPTLESYLALNGVFGEFEERALREIKRGEAVVKTINKVSDKAVTANCRVFEGVIKRDFLFRLKRETALIWEGKIDSLKRAGAEVSEVQEGLECELMISDLSNILQGDTLEAFEFI